MMKKIVCLVLAALMALSGVALASDADMLLWEFPEVGFTMSVPDDFRDLKGQVVPFSAVELGDGTGIYMFSSFYVALDRARFEALSEKGDDATDAEKQALTDALVPYLMLFIVRENAATALLEAFAGDDLATLGLRQVAKTGGCAFYSFVPPERVRLDDPEFDSEYASIMDRMDEVLAMCDFYAPSDPYADKVGQKLAFETTDLNGDPISSADLFARHEYTLLNVWATWCGSCVNELSELDALNERLGAMDCGVVGVLEDSAKAGKVDKAKAILAENGAHYPCIRATDELMDQLAVKNYPTTFIVDRTGAIVGEAVVGAFPDRYEAQVMALLNAK